MTTENAGYTGPTARDPLLGTEVPVYLGGEGPVEEPTGDRGDAINFTPTPVPESSVSESPVTETPPTETPVPERNADGTFKSKADIDAAAAAAAQEPGTQDPVTQEPGTQGDDAPRIPKKRLDAEIKKRRELEARLAQLENAKPADGTQPAAAPAPAAYDFDAAEEAFMDLLLDGKTKEAAAKRREIRGEEQKVFSAVAADVTNNVNTATKVRTAMDDISIEYETEYPGFNPESETYDANSIAVAEAVYMGYIQKKLYADPVDAYRAALDTVVAVNGWVKPKPNGKSPQPTAARTAAPRVAAITGQPPLTQQAGQSSAANGAAVVPNVMELTEDQLNKLPPATLARLRGDEL